MGNTTNLNWWTVDFRRLKGLMKLKSFELQEGYKAINQPFARVHSLCDYVHASLSSFLWEIRCAPLWNSWSFCILRMKKEVGMARCVRDTLFSGDPLTKLINTLVNLILTFSVLGDEGEVSIKGDDAVAILRSEQGAKKYIEEKAQNSVRIAPDKTVVSMSEVELERFSVDGDGFHSSLLRKIGSSPIAEVQGESNLSIRKHFVTAVESGGSPLLRGGDARGVELYINARLRLKLQQANEQSSKTM